MKSSILLLLILVAAICSYSQIQSNQKFFKTLPGFVPLEGEYLFIDEVEINNLAYREFLGWLKTSDVKQYQKMLPDSTVWSSKAGCNEPYVNYYFWHPAYSSYPVVGVSYEQAQAFCDWRADRIMEMLGSKGSDIDQIVVRLPSEAEWKKAARGTLPQSAVFPWEEKGLRKTTGRRRQKGLAMANILGNISSNVQFDGFVTTDVGSYWPNSIGLYQMAGNVSEWVEEHKAMGSNWNGFPQQANLHYSPPILPDSSRFSTVGFRCVLEIVSFKKELKSPSKELTAKDIEKEMIQLPFDSLYNNYKDEQYLFAAKSEVSNFMFNTFLAETKSQEHQSQSKNWYLYTRYHHMQMYHWHPFYDHFPVVNISYEAAQAYCKWLTLKYNSSSRRSYKKVEFKLPSKSEWEYAASGNNINPSYPWGGPYVRNSKAEFLANFCPLEEQYVSGRDATNSTQGGLTYNYPNGNYAMSRSADGVEFLCDNKTFFPNNFGLHHLAGNAAEMISEKGDSKGGSWDSNQYQIKIKANGQYSEPSSTLGFRVFMNVLEHW